MNVPAPTNLVAELQAANAQLERYRRLFEAMSEGMALHEIICDDAGTPCDYRFLDVNPAFERLTGLHREQIVGRTVREALPDIEPGWIETYGRVALTGEPAHLDAFAGPLGRFFEAYAYRPEPGQFVAVFLDVTERRRMEDALRGSEAWFRAIFDHSADGIVIADTDGVVTQMNPAAESMFGLCEKVALDQRFPYPLLPGSRQELLLAAAGEDERIVEMRVTEVVIGGRRTLHANLRDLTALARLREDLRTMALIDELTRAFNRRGLMTLGARQLSHAQRTGRSLWMLFADVDRMKWINDTLGHETGDKALIEFAEVLTTSLRQSDIVARIGGDEFAALALDATGDGIETIVRRLRANVEARNALPGRTYCLSFSLGTARFDPAKPCTLDALLAEADSRMYEQKRGRQAPAFQDSPES